MGGKGGAPKTRIEEKDVASEAKRPADTPFYTRTGGVMLLCAAGLLVVLLAAFWWYPPLVQGGWAPVAASQPFFEEQVGDRVNINTATAAELAVLPGIGEVRGQAIVEFREENGPFASVEELMDVKGIGPKIFEGLQAYVYAG